jgi:glycosyltransferase involved in cell wall biosynthesis
VPVLRNVLVVHPFPAYTWKSLTNYAEAVLAADGMDGVWVRGIPAPWWLPPGAREVVARRRQQPRVRSSAAAGSDIVHITDQGHGYLVDTFRGTPTVVTCHDVMPFVVPGFARNAVDGVVERALLRPAIRGMLKAQLIVAVSRCSADDITRCFGYDPDRIAVVPVPIAEAFAPKEDADAWLGGRGVALPARPRVLSVGSVERYKNLEGLLRCMAEPALRGATLVRVGAKLTADQRRLASRLGVAARVVELGNVPQETLVALYSACDVLAQPSLYEGFGMPVMEAMACGLPVVCSDRGALPEVADEAAVVAPIDHIRPFAAAMAALIDDESRRMKLRDAGMERAKAYRPRAVAESLFAVYRRVLAG